MTTKKERAHEMTNRIDEEKEREAHEGREDAAESAENDQLQRSGGLEVRNGQRLPFAKLDAETQK